MVKKIVFFMMVSTALYVINCSAKNNTQVKNPWADSLSCMDVSLQRQSEKIVMLTEQGLKRDSISTFNAIVSLLNKSNRYRNTLLQLLIIHCPDCFSNWMRRSGNLLDNDNWKTLAFDLRKARVSKDTLVINSVVAAILKSKPENVDWNVFSYLSDHLSYKNTLFLSKLIDKNFSNDSKCFILSSMSCYKDSNFDSITKKNLLPLFYQDDISFSLIEAFLKWSNRYDFLPDLYKFKENFKNGKINTQEKNMEKILDETITVLEQKKVDNAPIGRPLDWPKGVKE